MFTWFEKIKTSDSNKARYIYKIVQNDKTGQTRRWKVLTRLAKEVSQAKRAHKSYITGWKKVRDDDGFYNYISASAIVELRVPIRAAMRCPSNEKCRASRVKVVAIYGIAPDSTLGNKKHAGFVAKPYNKPARDTRYRVGEWVKPEYAFDKSNTECASGIHFFLDVEEALRWH